MEKKSPGVPFPSRRADKLNLAAGAPHCFKTLGLQPESVPLQIHETGEKFTRNTRPCSRPQHLSLLLSGGDHLSESICCFGSPRAWGGQAAALTALWCIIHTTSPLPWEWKLFRYFSKSFQPPGVKGAGFILSYLKWGKTLFLYTAKHHRYGNRSDE